LKNVVRGISWNTLCYFFIIYKDSAVSFAEKFH